MYAQVKERQEQRMQNIERHTKYSDLREFLINEINTGKIKPGEQIPSENNLADMHSMSRNTVRRVLSNLVSEGYLYTEHGRGTFCTDRNKIKKSTRNIGVITTYISEYIFPRVIHGIDNVLSENNYSIVLKNTGNNTEKEGAYLKEAVEKDFDGLIIEPTKSALFSDNIKFYNALDSRHIPYVFIHGCYQQLEGKPQIILDDIEGMYLAVKYLAENDHKNIIGIFKADDIQGVNRHKGYVRALAEAGIPYNPDYVIWFHTEDRLTKPYAALKMLLNNNVKIDAVACYNDEVAFKTYELLNGLGKNVPEDISITGFDDSYLSLNCPVKLTTVSHPKEKLGELAAEVLLDMIESGDWLNNTVRKVIKPELIVRDSCKRK